LTNDDGHAQFEAIVREANDKIKVLEPVEGARKEINDQMSKITGAELAQKTDLVFSATRISIVSFRVCSP
jgi:hypothetical protein